MINHLTLNSAMMSYYYSAFFLSLFIYFYFKVNFFSIFFPPIIFISWRLITLQKIVAVKSMADSCQCMAKTTLVPSLKGKVL